MPVGYHHDGIRFELRDEGLCEGILQLGGLKNAKAVFRSRLLYRWGLERVAASAGLIGIGDNQIGLEACLQQPLEARNSKLRRAAKKNVHDCGVVLLTTDN